MSFETLGLSAELLSAINEKGYTKPTPVQRQAIPAILQGRDIIAAAQTGTGKTAGFTLPLLHLLSINPSEGKKVRALIVTPTRELAAQVHESVETYGKNLPLKSCVVFGGVKINPQIAKLKRGSDIVIATPGRLLDLVNQGALSLSAVEMLVLDEADRMLDMGFIHDIKRILALLPKERQNLLFSATFSNEIRSLASKLLCNPECIEVSRRNTTAQGVTQIVHPVDKARKRELLSHVIGSENWKQVLVFTRTKHGANRLVKQLELDGLNCAAVHGNKSQGARTRALTEFKDGKIRVLVATDVAARGIDIDKLPYVVNFDLPNIPEDYVHRIGRTGRASNEGLAMSLVSPDELKFLHDIERLLKCKLPSKILPGYEPGSSSGTDYTHIEGDKPVKTRQSRTSPKTNQDRPTRSGQSTSTRSGSDRPARPDQRTSTRSGSDRPARPDQRTSTRSGSDRPARSGQSTSTRSGSDRPARSGQSTSTRSGSDRPARPGQRTSTRSGSDRPARPGQRTSTRSGSDRPARPGQHTSTRSGSDRPARSGQSTSTRSGSDRPARSGQSTSTRSGSDRPTRYGQSTSTRSGSDRPARSGQSTSTRSGSDRPAGRSTQGRSTRGQR